MNDREIQDATTPIYLTAKEIELVHAALGVFGSLAGQSSVLLSDYHGTKLADVFQQRAQDSAVLAAKFANATASFEWPAPKVTT